MYSYIVLYIVIVIIMMTMIIMMIMTIMIVIIQYYYTYIYTCLICVDFGLLSSMSADPSTAPIQLSLQFDYNHNVTAIL